MISSSGTESTRLGVLRTSVLPDATHNSVKPNRISVRRTGVLDNRRF